MGDEATWAASLDDEQLRACLREAHRRGLVADFDDPKLPQKRARVSEGEPHSEGKRSSVGLDAILSDDVLGYIFSMMRKERGRMTPWDVYSLHAVSHRWQCVAARATRHLKIASSPRYITARSFGWLLSRLPCLAKLTVLAHDDMAGFSEHLLRHSGSSLCALALHSCGIPPDELRALLCGLPLLREVLLRDLDYMNDENIDYAFLADGFPGLRALDIDVNHEQLESLALGCPNVEELTCQYLNHIEPATFHMLATCLPSLTKLELISRPCTSFPLSPCLPHLKFARLESLVLPNANATPEGVATLVGQLPCLTHLAMDPISSTGAQLPTYARIASLRRHFVKEASVEGLRALAAGCPELAALTLTNMDPEITFSTPVVFPRLTDATLISCDSALPILPCCAALRHVCLQSLDLFDSDLLALKACTHLQRITLLRLPNVSSFALGTLARACPLRHVVVTSCRRIKPVLCSYLASAAPCLERLELSLDNHESLSLGDAEFLSLAEGCPRLRWLSVSPSHATDTALQVLARLPLCHLDLHTDTTTDQAIETFAAARGRALTYLALRGTQPLTNRSLAALSQHCTRLRYLLLGKCKHITPSGLLHLRRNFVNLNTACISVVGPAMPEYEWCIGDFE